MERGGGMVHNPILFLIFLRSSSISFFFSILPFFLGLLPFFYVVFHFWFGGRLPFFLEVIFHFFGGRLPFVILFFKVVLHFFCRSSFIFF